MSAPHDAHQKVKARGETVSLWNSAAAGKPSPERIAASINEAHAALEAFAARPAPEGSEAP